MNKRGNFTLIGLLAAVAIIAILAAVYFSGGGVGTVKKGNPILDKASAEKTVVGQAIDTGKSVDCRQRLNQIRSGIAIFKTSDINGGTPPTLKAAVPGVSTAYFYCPVSDKAYEYNQAAGTVQCPTHKEF